MAVIINAFEVVVEETEESPEATEGEPVELERELRPQLRPLDIYDVIRHRSERMARIWAH